MTSNIFHQKYRLLLLIGGIILGIYALSQSVFFAENKFVLAHLNASKNENACLHAHTSLASDHIAPLSRPDFQSGMVYIQWGQDGYGSCNTQWQKGLDDVHTQTGARWLEMPVTFTQASQTSTHIVPLPTTPSAKSFQEGIASAHAMGYHVFVVPLIGISNGRGRWSGAIHFTNAAEVQEWFNNYWQVFRPYVVAAAQGRADQVAVGTEDEWLEEHAPASVWNRFITQVHGIFPGTLTYDMNWSGLTKPIPSWMANPTISMVGISEYISLTDSRADRKFKNIASLWSSHVKALIDTFATQVKKPVFLSEIGYRDSTDALYNPWEKITAFPRSPQQQAAACNAALANIFTDTHIHGVYFWAWDNVDLFNLHNTLAVTVIHKWYTSSKA